MHIKRRQPDAEPFRHALRRPLPPTLPKNIERNWSGYCVVRFQDVDPFLCGRTTNFISKQGSRCGCGWLAMFGWSRRRRHQPCLQSTMPLDTFHPYLHRVSKCVPRPILIRRKNARAAAVAAGGFSWKGGCAKFFVHGRCWLDSSTFATV